MDDAACVVQLAKKINEQSSNKVDLDEVKCDFLKHALWLVVNMNIHCKGIINVFKLHRQF